MDKPLSIHTLWATASICKIPGNNVKQHKEKYKDVPARGYPIAHLFIPAVESSAAESYTQGSSEPHVSSRESLIL